MLQNLKRIDENADELIDPSFLLDKQIIITKNSKDINNIKIENYSWWNNFDSLEFNSILEEMRKTQKEYLQALDLEKKTPLI
jgi:hypothetical protein